MPRHVVVDGSNIGTEGRVLPSLHQLNEAVLAFLSEFPEDKVTVVVDATFGHRIDPAEVPEFNAAIENNELVCPPAGAVGRGDAFVLAIAHKVGAAILSNDSYQEFHGDHPWLFDEGRLLGGKPVPHVGWVFVARTPVRGPISRRAVKGRKAGRNDKATRPSPAASQPMPVPKAPPPRAPRAGRSPAPAAEAAPAAPAPSGRKQDRQPARADAGTAPTQARGTFVNESLPFLTFVGAHPVGARIEAVVESYSSHGAYVIVEDTRCYVPLRFMADPAPRAARDVVKLGQTYPFVVVSFNAGRRSIDLAVPGFEPAGVPAPTAAAAPTGRKARGGRSRDTAAAEALGSEVAAAAEVAPAPAPSRRAAKRTPAGAAAAPETAAVDTAAEAPDAAARPAGRGRRGRRGEAPAAPEPAPAPVVDEARPGRRRAGTATAAPPVAASAAADGGSAPAQDAPAPARRSAKATTKRAQAPDAAPSPAAAEAEAVQPVRKAAARAKAAPAPKAPTKATTAKSAPVKAAPAAKATKSSAPAKAPAKAATGAADAPRPVAPRKAASVRKAAADGAPTTGADAPAKKAPAVKKAGKAAAR